MSTVRVVCNSSTDPEQIEQWCEEHIPDQVFIVSKELVIVSEETHGSVKASYWVEMPVVVVLDVEPERVELITLMITLRWS